MVNLQKLLGILDDTADGCIQFPKLEYTQEVEKCLASGVVASAPEREVVRALYVVAFMLARLDASLSEGLRRLGRSGQ